jgi:hypothetical protein
MNSVQIQAHLEKWALSKNFDAPYGVLTGEFINRKGKKYMSVTFGRARTLDASVEIYNRNFMVLKTSRYGTEVFKDLADLETKLETL